MLLVYEAVSFKMEYNCSNGGDSTYHVFFRHTEQCPHSQSLIVKKAAVSWTMADAALMF